jgi:DNA-binding response OmpR family regulator
MTAQVSVGPSGPATAGPHARTGRILVVDDEPKIRSFIGRALTAAGFEAEFAGTGTDAVGAATADHFDLIILDLVMPDMNGREVLAALLRARPGQAIMVLSCVSDVATKVDCLEQGALDYLTKPFSLAELLARVRIRLPRSPGAPASRPLAHGEIIHAGAVILDTVHLTADAGAGPVPLTRLEFMLLRELTEYPGHSVGKDKLLATVWGYDFDPGSNVVDVCVRRLRSKLGFDLIKTVRGEGYMLAGR